MLRWIRIIKRRRGGRRKQNSKDKLNLEKYKVDAKALALSRLEHFNHFYNFKYNSVKIKSQKTRWGSCSSKGNLNFNYKMIMLPQELVDYLIVHELCHLGEFNHSQKFWCLVSKTIPDYLERRNELRKIRLD